MFPSQSLEFLFFHMHHRMTPIFAPTCGEESCIRSKKKEWKSIVFDHFCSTKFHKSASTQMLCANSHDKNKCHSFSIFPSQQTQGICFVLRLERVGRQPLSNLHRQCYLWWSCSFQISFTSQKTTVNDILHNCGKDFEQCNHQKKRISKELSHSQTRLKEGYLGFLLHRQN